MKLYRMNKRVNETETDKQKRLHEENAYRKRKLSEEAEKK